MTSIRLGWARQQYGRDRCDFEIDLGDLPRILLDHGCDPASAEAMPYSAAMGIVRLQAEVFSRDVYLRHEIADEGWEMGKPVTSAVAAAKQALDTAKAQLARVLAPYKAGKAAQP